MPDLGKRIEALELSVEGLLKLLGDTEGDRMEFYGRIKGLTTPAEFRLASAGLSTAQKEITNACAGLEAIQIAARETGRVGAAS